MASARMAGQNQIYEAQGAAQMQDKEQARTETLLGMSQQRVGAANEARAAATSQLVGGIGNIAGSGLTGLAGTKARGGEGTSLFQSMLGN